MPTDRVEAAPGAGSAGDSATRGPPQTFRSAVGTFPTHRRCRASDITRDDAKEAPAAMYSIFYLIGVVVVILAVLSLLGLA